MKPILLAVFPFAEDLEVMDECNLLSGMFAVRSGLEFREIANANFQRLSDKLKDDAFVNQVTVFHYGGHAGGKNILLPDAEGDMRGLGKLLADLPNLQLVFINGCDSFEQAEILLELKNIAVIVTKGKIRDDIAMYFAEQFYSIWKNNHTIQHAFTRAQARVESKFGAGRQLFSISSRGIKFNTAKNTQEPVYCLCGDAEKLGENMLEYFEQADLPDPDVPYKPSRQLASVISKAILEANNPDAAEIIKFKESYDLWQQNVHNPRNFASHRNSILQVIPSPICFHLSLLWSAGNNPNTTEQYKELLTSQIATYAASLQLLSLSMLNCFLEEYENGKILLNPEVAPQMTIIKSFLQSTDPNNIMINSPLLLIAIRKVFAANTGITPFIREYQSLQQIFPQEADFLNTHEYILGLRESLKNGQIRQKNVRMECYQMELMLCGIFSQAGFLAKYKLTSVREISYRKGRVKQAKYEIYRTVLDNSMLIEYYPEYFDRPTDTHSVIFARGLNGNDFTSFMNLSPYIIDDSSIKGESTPNLYFFSHKADGNYIYRRFDEPDNTRIVKEANTFKLSDLSKKDDKDLEIINYRMTAIKEEMEHFENLIP